MARGMQANLQKYLKRIEAAEQFRDGNYRDLWNRCYKRYRNRVDPLVDKKGKPITDRSNISIPYTFNQVETILPRLVETLFAARPVITVKGREPQDDANAMGMETLLDWQMNERCDLQSRFKSGLKGMCIYGTAVAFVPWRLDERKVIRKQLQPVMVDDGLGGQKPLVDKDPDSGDEIPVQDWRTMEVTEAEYDDPDPRFIDLGLFYVDPNAEDIPDARYCGHVSYESRDYLQKMHDQENWKIDWRKIPKDSKKNDARQQRMSQVGISAPEDSAEQADNDALYEVHHYFEDDRYVVIINRAYIARDSKNPFWHKRKPYCKDVYTDVPHEFYGMGVVEMLEDLQDELNNERNMRIDFRAFILRRMWKIRRGADINPADLVWRQGGHVYVDDHEDLQEMGVTDVPASTFTEEATIKQDMQDTSGAQDVVMGNSGGGETATTTMSKDNNASMRFRLIISSVEKKLLVGIARFMMQLNQQFVETDRMIRVAGEAGEEWRTVTPEDIQGEFDLVAAGSSVEPMANKEAFKQRMVELFSIAAKDPFMMQFPVYRRNLLKKVFEAFDIKNTDDLLPSDDELNGAMEQQIIGQFLSTLPPQLQQLLAAAMGGGGGLPAPSGMPPEGEPMQSGGGANTAPMMEAGMQMMGGGVA